jgi:hypothetical protein
MARSSQTQQKRQRENKLREKAQLKRDRRQERQAEKKIARAQEPQPLDEPLVSAEDDATDGNVPALEPAGTDTIVIHPVDPNHTPTDWTSTQANSQGKPQIGGIMASKLFVGNLPRTVTDNDLAEFVTSAGFQVTSAQVIRDKATGDPKGFGFVGLAEGTNLQQAIGGLNGQMLQNRALTVNEARPQRSGSSESRGGFGSGGRDRGGFGRRRDY